MQLDIIDCVERNSITFSTTKGGKTTVCIIWIIEQALQGVAGDNCWWIAPTYAVSKIAFRRIKQFFNNDKRLYRENKSELRITLPNEVSIWFKSGDNPDVLYGDDVIACVMDEGPRMKVEAYYAVRSVLTATHGKLKIIGNVQGRNNWVHQLSVKIQNGELENWFYNKITVYDAIAGGVIDPKEFEQAKMDLPEEVIRELYEADPIDDRGRPFIWGFGDRNIIDTFEVKDDLPINLSFDFNVDPMTLTLHQHDPYNFDWICTFDEIKLRDSNIYEVIETLKSRYGMREYEVTGDRNGHSRDSLVKDNRTHYKTIKQLLDLPSRAMKAPQSNPAVNSSRLLTNTLFRKHPDRKIAKQCKNAIDDLKFTQATEDGKVDKTDGQKSHFIDNIRYYDWTYFKKYVKKYLPLDDQIEDDLNE